MKDEEQPKRDAIDALRDEDAFDNGGLLVKAGSRGKKRKMGVFSAYYNFYFELCKRLKMRMKENKKNFKFRKIYNRSRSVVPVKTVKTTTKKIVRKKPLRTSKSATKTKKETAIEETKKLEAVAAKAKEQEEEDEVNIDTDYGGEEIESCDS